MAQEIKFKDPQQDFMPLLPLRDVVVYPHLVIPLFVGRTKSVKALEIASDKDKKIILVAQKSASKDEPDAKDLYEYGTVASILQMLKLPDGTVKVLVEGLSRVKIKEVLDQEACFVARFDEINIPEPKDKESLALMRTVFSQFDQYVKLNKKIILIDCLLPINEMDLHKAKLLKTGKPIYFEERNIKVPNKILPKNYIVNEIKHKFPTVASALKKINVPFKKNFLKHEYAQPWLKMMHEEMEKIADDKSDINPYATTNQAEFFAVTAEYFFEKPELMKDKHPELYAKLSKIFAQDLAQ